MIYDFRILPFALGDIIISMIHGTVDLKNQMSKDPFFYYRKDLVKVHPIQTLINKRNVKTHLGDLNEALLFNPQKLPVKEISNKTENAGCETLYDLTINEFYQKYVKSNQTKEYHIYFNLNVASHKSLNKWNQENNQIPQLQSPRDIILETKKLIKKYTGKKKWICAHLRFRGIEQHADLADIKRNADPAFWHIMLSGIAEQYKKEHAALLLPQLGKIQKNASRRRERARWYKRGLQNIPEIELFPAVPRSVHAHHLYPILVPAQHRGIILQKLREKGVETTVNYRPVHLLSYFRGQPRWAKVSFPVAEKLGERVLSLPFYPGLGKKECDYVIRSLKQILQSLPAES